MTIITRLDEDIKALYNIVHRSDETGFLLSEEEGYNTLLTLYYHLLQKYQVASKGPRGDRFSSDNFNGVFFCQFASHIALSRYLDACRDFLRYIEALQQQRRDLTKVDILALLKAFERAPHFRKERFSVILHQGGMQSDHLLQTRRNLYSAIQLDSSIEDLQTYIDLMISIIREDLCTCCNTEIFYIPSSEADEVGEFFPIDGIQSWSCRNEKYIQLDDYGIISCPWSPERAAVVLRDFQNDGGFVGQKAGDDVIGCCFEEIKLALLYGSRHHAGMASLLGKGGSVKVRSYCLTDVFEELETDGDMWFDKDGSPFAQVKDDRIAILYSLAKDKYLLKKQGIRDVLFRSPPF